MVIFPEGKVLMAGWGGCPPSFMLENGGGGYCGDMRCSGKQGWYQLTPDLVSEGWNFKQKICQSYIVELKPKKKFN